MNSVLEAIRNNLIVVGRLIENESYDECKNILHQTSVNLERIRSIISNRKYTKVKDTITSLETICLNTINLNSNYAYRADRIRSGNFHYVHSGSVLIMIFLLGVGRPVVSITAEQLHILYAQGYTANKMAKHFGCSISTVYKKCYKEGIKFRSKYSVIDDEDLIQMIEHLNEKYPNSGYVVSIPVRS